MDTSFEDLQNVKIPPLSAQDTQKKKRPSKKKSEPKPPKVVEPEIPEVIPDLNTEAEADLINYTYKLEYELAATKKKIKQERKKFRQLIHSFAKHMDAKGTTASLVDDYIQSLNPQINESLLDSDFEKLFTTHKYQVVDDSGHLHNGNTNHKATNSRKTVTKSQPNLLKGASGEKSILNNESTAAGSPHEQIAQQSNSGKTAQPKPRKEKVPKSEGEAEPKKRKPKKAKEIIEENDNDDVIEIPEIPPLDLKPKKDQKVDEKQILAQQNQYQQGQPNPRMANTIDMIMQNPNMLDDALKTLMQQVNIDPNQLLQINPYLMMNSTNQPQVQENDMVAYEKMLQEMMKGGNANQLLAPDKETQDLLNYYQRSFK